MAYSFTVRGHPNIRATHRTTLEFTKESYLTLSGDCIVGVRASFEVAKLKEFLKKEKIKIYITAAGVEDVITAVPNPSFSDEREMVIRIGEFCSARTFAVRANKASYQLKKELKEKLKNDKNMFRVEVE